MPDTATPEAVEEVEKTQEEESAERPQSGKPKSGGLMQTVIIVAATQLITLAGAFFFVKMYLVPKVTVEEAIEKPIEHKRGPVQIYMIEDLVVNPAGTNGTRYLSASIGLEYAKAIDTEDAKRSSGGHGEGAAAGLGNKEPIIRDILIAVLTSKNIEQLSSAQGKETLREEIMDAVNYEVAPDTVYKVYLVDYVLQ